MGTLWRIVRTSMQRWPWIQRDSECNWRPAVTTDCQMLLQKKFFFLQKKFLATCCKKINGWRLKKKKKQSRSFFTQTRPSCAAWRKPGNKKTCHNWIFLQIILIFFPRYREWGIHDLSWNSAFVTIQRSISGAKKKVLIYKSYCMSV